MLRLVLTRLALTLPILFGLVTITFILVQLAPGDPAAIYLDPSLDPQAAAEISRSLGLNDPVPERYLKWLGFVPPFNGLLQGNLGLSLSTHAPVSTELMSAMGSTLLVASLALLVNFALGIGLGVVAGLNKDSLIDRSISAISIFLYSIPNFWLALVLIMVFSLWLGWLPATHLQTTGLEASGLSAIVDLIAHLILPVFVLGVTSAAGTARFVRSSIVEILNSDYIRTATAMGLSRATIIRKYLLRNALSPIITVFGLAFPFLLGGAVIVEVIFALPGMGRLTVDAILARDYPLIVGCVLAAGGMVILGNLIADILYRVVDPRIS